MKKPSNKSIVWLLVIAIVLVTAFGIWTIYQVYEVVIYQECLETNQCKEIK